ncbi:HutD family protein [Microbacterium sp. NPDC078428]|uniref:HutD family protein n=1 Tax=Microbacterium sp. NPDC078428 TaxID=3364190 RepID=UPI0037C583A4
MSAAARPKIPPSWDVVTPASVVAEPWANGMGVTRVLARRLAWRLSLAEIRGRSVFSNFPGVDRLLVLAGDQPLTLMIDSVRHRLVPGDVVRFPGEARVIPAPMSAGALVVNLMTPRAFSRGDAETVRFSGSFRVAADDPRPVVVLSGYPALAGARLPVGAALLPSVTDRDLEGDAVIARLSIHPLTHSTTI